MNPTTINPNANFFEKGQGGNPSVINATAPTTPFDATRLGTAPTVNLKPTPQIPVPDITSLTGSDTTAMVAPQAPQPKKGLADKLAGLFGQSKGKEQELQSQVAMQTQPFAQQLNELNTQIKMQQAKAIANQEAVLKGGGDLGFQSREAQSIARTDAIEALKLSALAEGMRGNIALAESQATQAINAKYAQVDKEIEDTKSNIYANYDSMTPAEKKRADATLLRIDAQDAFVKAKKEDEKITQGFLQDAIAQSAQNGTPIPTLVLQRANQAETPTQALQILAPYMVDAQKKANDLLDYQIKREQLNKVKAETAKLEREGKPVVVDTSGKLVLPADEAQKVNKEIASNDAFKAMTKAKDSLQFLTDFEKTFKDVGATSAVFSPRSNAKLKTQYNSTILNLKEFFNLGVLNGPDENILRGIIPDPTDRSAVLPIASFGIYKPSAGTKSGIESMKKQIEQTLDERYKSLSTQYSAYSPQGVSALKDVQRTYIEQKAKLNPEVAKLISENPGLTEEDIISIMGI